MEITLREITSDSLKAVLNLRVSVDQERLVASNARSIAEAHFSDHAWFRAIYAQDEPVGFLMLYIDESETEYYLWRLMIDHRFQGRRYASEALKLAIAHVRTLPNAFELKTSYVPGEGSAGSFYEKMGFKETGEVDDGEIVLSLALKA